MNETTKKAWEDFRGAEKVLNQAYREQSRAQDFVRHAVTVYHSARQTLDEALAQEAKDP